MTDIWDAEEPELRDAGAEEVRKMRLSFLDLNW